MHKPLYEFLPPWINFKPIDDEQETDSAVATNENITNTCHRYKDLEFKLPVKDPDDCHCFYHCAWGQVVGHECCPSNLAFNPITLTCDWLPKCVSSLRKKPSRCYLPTSEGSRDMQRSNSSVLLRNKY